MNKLLSYALLATGFAGLSLFGAVSQAAEAWPSKPIRLIVPFQAGSATDAAARVVGQKMAGILGQTVIIDNRVGASGYIGAETVARAAPDGYTILLGTTSTQAIGVSLNSHLSYNPEKDFAPIGLIGSSPYVVVVPASLPVTDLKQLIALAKSKPGVLTYASAGTTSFANLAAQLFSMTAKVQLTHVPYKSSAQSVTDTINGTISVQFGTVQPVMPHVRSGALKALAVTGLQRLPLLPNVPTVSEAALPGYDAVLWMGLFAPAGTPPAAVAKMSAALKTALADHSVDEGLLNQGLQATPTSSEELAKFVHEEIVKWGAVVKSAGIVAE
jgi:tripartite-type tricarboxylate transporter receptor subunit TctC